MKMIVGLGNPGPSYTFTRHNVGFLFIDYLQMYINNLSKPSYQNKFDAEVESITLQNQKIILLKPQTYMNLSGKAIQKAMTFYKIKPEDIIVCHDEIDLPFGKIKAKFGGGSGGHNGIKSIDSLIGNNYYRIRFGVGRSTNISDYVLSNFSQQELEVLINDNFPKIGENITLLLDKELSIFTSKLREFN
ncbi:aminoacyl-tRNA hydrolase [Rickettsiales endosymbiont of Stachyamoeba lipophora]|uniref:aminoacyl-tRNA hydrolase n=1 Tax=Rickettsiales endosymbiont of Stachyamoeba lipophora TaxID=2486578 RepID=UPI000F653181|nr:aminoacyl-tRNA hydrolase [Rickettsiales endosymbiont of Stachyamoeba lipophora]AZL15740.1 aminoacyl-tRNA hydrolase [Rickettsiales endosymbiont of Stachyamoeba lipophora]